MAAQKRSGSSLWIVIIVSVLALGGLFWFFLSSNSKPYKHWSEQYLRSSKQPYGLYLLHSVLEQHFDQYDCNVLTERVFEELNNADEDSTSNYVFVGERVFLDSADKSALLNFVKRGNTALIAATASPEYLFADTTWMYYYGYDHYNYNYQTDTAAYMNFRHSSLNDSAGYRFTYIYGNEEDSSDYEWYYWDPYFEPDTPLPVVEIGYMEGYPNLVTIPYGKGEFYFHTVPITFTNHFLMQKRGREYAEKVLSHLQEGEIYWDAANRTPHYDYEGGGWDSRRRSDSTPLIYVLSQPALRWAIYMALLVLLTYILFRAKRRQRTVPVLDPNTNSSLEFLQTIGSLYFLQNDHKKLCAQKMKLFLAFIRNRYHLSTHHQDEALIKAISVKSHVDYNEVEEIFKKYKAIEYLEETSNELLIAFHKSIERFYQTCK